MLTPDSGIAYCSAIRQEIRNATTAATPGLSLVFFFSVVDRSGIRRSMLMVRESLRQFVREHISEPFWGIYNELVHNQPLTMTDAKALADSSHRFVHASRLTASCVAHNSCFFKRRHFLWLTYAMLGSVRIPTTPCRVFFLFRCA